MAFRDMIIDVSAQVEDMVGQGLSYEEISAANPTETYNTRYGDPDRFLRAAFIVLGGEF